MRNDDGVLDAVVFGGGTAGPPVSEALLKLTTCVTSVAPSSDSGGNSGELRDLYGVLPAGDVRRFLVAHHDSNGDNSLRTIFNLRHPDDGSKLAGLVVGNFFVSEPERHFGSAQGLRLVSRALKIRGKVLYATLSHVHLIAELSDGRVLRGEKAIDTRSIYDDAWIKSETVRLEPYAVPNPEVLEAIAKAQLIFFAPGDFYSSLWAILIVDLMIEALRKSPVRKVLITSLMTKKAETHGFDALTFVQKLADLGVRVDATALNVRRPPERLLKLYREERSHLVKADNRIQHAIRKLGVEVIVGEFLSEEGFKQDLIRHDADAVVHDVLRWFQKNKLAA